MKREIIAYKGYFKEFFEKEVSNNPLKAEYFQEV